MIARLWHGKVPLEKSQRYHQYLLETGLHDYKQEAGNRGVFLLKRDDHDVTHFYTLSFWDDIESIRLFAGEEYHKARYYPEDGDYLLDFEQDVLHLDVLEYPPHFATPPEGTL